MKKNWLLFLLSSVLVFALAACQQDGAKLKETYTSAYKKMKNAETYEFSTDLGLKVDVSNLSGAEDQKAADMINNAKLTISGKTNTKTKQSEVVFKGKINVFGKPMNFDIPVYMDEKKQIGYIKLDSVIENFGPMIQSKLGLDVTKLKGKYLELPLDEMKTASNDTEKMQNDLVKTLQKAVDDISDDKFEKEDLTDKEKKQGATQKITVSIQDEKIKDIMMKVMDTIKQTTGGKTNKEDLEKVKFENFKVTSTFDDKDNFLTQDLSMKMAFDQKDYPKSFTITTSTTYKNIDGKVTFSTKPKKDEIVTLPELQGMPANGMMQPSGF
ncbi:hypothetical protein [Bacillus changyiensis]|uniref:hypothetical protein n=1 Tax=Bacillus changyiensis TaxID=3004103 RepID=UPI0022E80815|nr:hypothetical protein [Bacillus changyiensis]MDA1475079.1 hypothetical protein [Bacillus changyiensis]